MDNIEIKVKKLLKTKKADRKRNISIPGRIRLIVIVFLFALLVASGYFWYAVEFSQKHIDGKLPVYSYTCIPNVGYEVFYTPNEVFAEGSLGEDQLYVTRLVDHIQSNFSCQFSADKPALITGSYSATAYLKGIIKGLNVDKVLWSKEYELLVDKTFSKNGNEVSIDYDIPIVLTDILEYANEVKSILNINSTVQLEVVYNILINAATEQGTVNEEFSPSLIIPISTDYFAITKNIPEIKAGSIDEQVKSISPSYEKDILFVWLLIVLICSSLIFVLVFTRKLVINPQQEKIDRLFKKYGSRIVVANSDILYGSKEIIEVSTIDGLIKTADDLGKPILYKNNSINEESCRLFVLDNMVNYIFRLEKF